MATLVVAAVGTVFGGTAALLAGGVMGAMGLLGKGPSREGPRLNDLAVQSSAYGTPLARLYGHMRASGSVIWATDIKETAHRSGGGKGKPKTTNYSYSVSFAVALSARPIKRIGRIWADGKLIRSANGRWTVPVIMRLYTGHGDAEADPLIASVEGIGRTPAYRGMAYVVFEDLDLSEFANHIPSLSFEVIADEAAISPATIIDDLCQPLGFGQSRISSAFSRMKGYGVASAGSIGSVVASLAVFEKPFLVSAEVGAAAIMMGKEDAPLINIDARFAGAVAGIFQSEPERRVERAGADDMRSELSLAYYDAERDYQPGLQRAVTGLGGTVERAELPASLSAHEAKMITERRIARMRARDVQMTIRLPYSALHMRPGDMLRFKGEATVWQVREITVEHMVAEVIVERMLAAPNVIRNADAGRSATQHVSLAGDTLLEVMDLPPLYDELPSVPRLWVATAGTEQGWRKADIAMSLDEGSSWQSLFVANGASVMGVAQTRLEAAPSTMWDMRGVLDVEMANDAMWLEGRSEESLLAGANMALLGNEIIQFGKVDSLGNRRFRLSRLLRGRRGTEWAMGQHQAGERFILLDPALLGAVDVPASRINANIQLRATPPGGDPSAAEGEAIQLAGNALRPPSPVHLKALRLSNGDLSLSWIRRSRQGWGWHDGADAPLGEEQEKYRIVMSGLPYGPKVIDTSEAEYIYTSAAQQADEATLQILISVAQLSAIAGPGHEAYFQLP